MDQQQEQFHTMLKERFALLPKVVQDAIMSTHVEQHLRELSNTHKLHLDQWEKLENEVQLTLLGINEAEELEQNVRREVGVPEDVARILANDIAHTVFEPIREELERQLPSPEALETKASDSPRSEIQPGTDMPVPATPPTVSLSSVLPATPPQTVVVEKVERTPPPETYAPKTPSHERKEVKGDPYREQI